MQQLTSSTILQGGKYKIEKVLGQGGFGITYLAEQVMLGRKVAIKEFFMKDLCNRDDDTSHVSVGSTGSMEMVDRFKEKFLKEAKMIAGMDNSHIVRIHDIFEENGTAYYVMENIDGGSADKLVKDGALQISRAIKIIQEIGSALEYIHNQNILHLDVKPSNILLRPNGEAVLIDFGISKRYDVEGGQTSTTPTGISKGYAPIEQYNQGLQNFSPATDVYSLGATLYKLLTGQTPPEAPELIDGEELAGCPKGVPKKVWVAVEKAMEPRRKKRFQSVHEFISMTGYQNARTTVELKPNEEETAITLTQSHNEDSTISITDFGKPKLSDIEQITVQDICFTMIRIQHGDFEMGATREQLDNAYPDEKPAHHVSLSKDYMLAQTPVTISLWDAVMGSTNYRMIADNRPITEVNWTEIQEFLEKLNHLTGRTFRLPTEAEWEFAARGGIKANGFVYSGSNDADEVAWTSASDGNGTHPVMKKRCNELGLYDMSGNVWESCADWYEKYDSKDCIDPQGPKTGTRKVCRGGSFYNSRKMSRVSIRLSCSPDSHDNIVGFRLAL